MTGSARTLAHVIFVLWIALLSTGQMPTSGSDTAIPGDEQRGPPRHRSTPSH